MNRTVYAAGSPLLVDLLQQVVEIALQRENVLVFVIDGLGKGKLQLDWRKKIYHTVFPSSTPSFFYTYFSLLLPGEHGFLEWYANFSDVGIKEPVQIPPYTTIDNQGVKLEQKTVFPFKSFLTELVARGIRCTLITPYPKSLFSRSAVPEHCYTRKLRTLSDIFPLPSSGFTFVYWPEIDRILHEEWKSEKYYRELEILKTVFQLVKKSTAERTHIFVFSDHGLKRCTIPVALPKIFNTFPYGGGRVAFYNSPGNREEEYRAMLSKLLGAHLVVGIDEIKDLLGGKISQRSIDRYGNIVVIAEGDNFFVYPYRRSKHNLLGYHGGLSKEEMEVNVWYNKWS